MQDDKTGGSEKSGQALYAPTGPATERDAASQGLDQTREFRDDAEPDESDEEEAAGPPISADMQRFIGRQLRAVYDDVAKQPVPDRFLELMKQLESKTASG